MGAAVAAVLAVAALVIILTANSQLQQFDSQTGPTEMYDAFEQPLNPNVKLLAQGIAVAEGFGIIGSIPERSNNPGDLKLGSDYISVFSSAAEGWSRLYHQINIIVEGKSKVYNLSMTLLDMAQKWTATEKDAWAINVQNYLNNNGLPNVTLDTTLQEIIGG
jgi:hypothetical protein